METKINTEKINPNLEKERKRYTKKFYFCDKKTGVVSIINFSRFISLAEQQFGSRILETCFPAYFDLTEKTINNNNNRSAIEKSRYCVFSEIVPQTIPETYKNPSNENWEQRVENLLKKMEKVFSEK